jgi:hypothetical protein
VLKSFNLTFFLTGQFTLLASTKIWGVILGVIISLVLDLGVTEFEVIPFEKGNHFTDTEANDVEQISLFSNPQFNQSHH